jgi:hypothetical protein
MVRVFYEPPPFGPGTDLNRSSYGVHGGGSFSRLIERLSKAKQVYAIGSERKRRASTFLNDGLLNDKYQSFEDELPRGSTLVLSVNGCARARRLSDFLDTVLVLEDPQTGR